MKGYQAESTDVAVVDERSGEHRGSAPTERAEPWWCTVCFAFFCLVRLLLGFRTGSFGRIGLGFDLKTRWRSEVSAAARDPGKVGAADAVSWAVVGVIEERDHLELVRDGQAEELICGYGVDRP